MSALNMKGKGLEIGPSHNPLAPKSQGYDVKIMDHCSAEELRAKFTGHKVNLENIEEVDYIWSGQPYAELIGGTDRFDWIIASHVVEHVPDLVTFLQQCESVLKPEVGVLSLVVPDRRYCFDYFMPVSTTGRVLDAYHTQSTRPTPGQVWDHNANCCARGEEIAWKMGQKPTQMLHSEVDPAIAAYKLAVSGTAYQDSHVWRFTPAVFKLIVSDLRTLGLIRLGIVSTSPSEGCEFYMALGFNAPAVTESRWNMLQAVLNEAA